MSQFVNGYLPVVALLCLIMILPVIFELVARIYEKRKTVSDVQNSMLGRYFYYQVINLYISVTAGALWKVLGDILDHPSSLLKLLGESLPSMVGYFVAFLVTKILAGLPMVFLRIGALSKMILRRTVSSTAKLTQRELDEMYRPENVQVSCSKVDGSHTCCCLNHTYSCLIVYSAKRLNSMDGSFLHNFL